jgi:hypothetical protein
MPLKATEGLRGKALAKVQAALAEYVVTIASTLPLAREGRYPDPIHRAQPPGVPFEITLHKWPRSWHAKPFEISQLVSGDIEAMRRERIERAYRKKYPKLAAWNAAGARTIFVLEDNDIQLSNESGVADAVLAIEKTFDLKRPDEIYLVTTFNDPWFGHVIRIGGRSFFDYSYEEQPKRHWEIDPKTLICLGSECAIVTWVIGAASIFGYGVILSDVRVTFRDGSTADILKKAHPLGPYIAAGFAGSVLIGYRLLESLRQFLIPPEDNVAWQPEWVAERWAAIAKEVYESSSLEERKLGARLLMVGISPDQNMGTPDVPRVYIIRFASPHFVPGFVRRGLNVAHIGSGSTVRRYVQGFRSHFRYTASSLKAEIGSPHGWAQMLGSTVDLIANKHPLDGVSPHVHIIQVRLGEFSQGVNNRKTYMPDGSGPLLFEMPDVAADYPEFRRLCRARVIAAECAIA